MNQFLPVTKADLAERGWEEFDFLVITGDAYVDHPSFGPAIISRVLEAEGYRVAILAQPDWRKASSFTALGRPRLGVLLSSGNIDSMVAHYTVAKKRRHDDAYSPGNRAGLRPDRAVIVYANKVREAFGDIPLVIGGLEASLRRFAHYDYWEDKVRRAILFDSQADLLVYGMGERATREIAARLASGTPIREITDVKGTAFIAKDPSACAYPKVECPSFEAVSTDKRAYAQANQIQYEEHDPVRGKAILQRHGDRLLVVNPPAMPLTTAELDFVAELPYVREPHPMYDEMGGVPAIEEVRFSVAHNRGCFGACNFCSLAFHQGRIITSRSHESVLREVEALTRHPGFKGYIHDVGGPTANFRRPACKKQMKAGMCRGRACLAPTPCPNLDADHTDYLMLLRKIRQVPGVKKVFIRSGIRFGLLCSPLLAEAIGLGIFVLSPLLVAAFNSSPEVIAYGVADARTVSLFYFLLAFSHCCAGILRGTGRPIIPMAIMLATWCALRIAYITAVTHFIPDIRVIYWAYPLTWFLGGLLFAVCLLRLRFPSDAALETYK